MSKKQVDVYRTGMYLRLSQGDEDIDGWDRQESNSIYNQKLLLEGYIDAHDDLKLVDVFVDDGYSVSNFDRPEFQRMMAPMKAGNLDCIIVKDLSRLARERIGADELILRIFKKYGVRFIAVSDNYDGLTANRVETHTIIPFKNLMNEQYNNDTSTKVRAGQNVKRMNGQFIGAFAPYGYKKAENNKNLLVPDSYAAGVVQGIFAKKLAGMSASGIAKILNKNGVLSPSEYKVKCGEKYNRSFKGAGQSIWSAKTVGRILKNVVYIGTLAQGKRTTVSHKVKKEIQVPECDWIVIENAHEPIISKMDFDAAQILMSRDIKAIVGQSESYMYAGILYCGDCGRSMVHRRMEQIAMYLRLSKEDEFIRDESNSITNQRAFIRSYINKDKAIRKMNLLEFVDDGYTGKNMDCPDMQRMLDLVKRKQISCVIMKDFSRFFRDHIEHGKYIEPIFPFMSVRFIAINDNYDSADYVGGIGEIDVAFKGILYDLFSEEQSVKVSTTFDAKRGSGKYISAFAPYGYVKSSENKHKLVVDGYAGQIVKRIFREYLSVKSMYKIAEFLNQEEIATPGVCIAMQEENER